MSTFKGFSVVKIQDQSVIASGLRFNAARRKFEQLNQGGNGAYKIQEDWEGAPITVVDKIHKKP